MRLFLTKRMKHLKYLTLTIFAICLCFNVSVAQSAYVDFTKAAEHAVNTVVHINAEMEQKSSSWDNFFSDPFFDFFNYQPRQQVYRYQAYGSGVIISEDGYIVTNNHVVSGAKKISVTLNDKHKYNAEIIGTDETSDLALLKIKASNLDYIKYGNSDEVKIGEWVLAVGNPYNLNSTVTAGIVSAKARNLNILGQGTKVESFIQTDAAVNSGNSGGALVNQEGFLIGINAAIASNTGSYSGYSFAIPVNIVKKIVRDLKQYGRAQRVHMGASFEEVSAEKADELKLAKVSGLEVKWVEKDASFDLAGIKVGDIILSADGKDVNTVSELQEFMEQKVPGDKVKLNIITQNKNKIVNVVMRNQRGTTEAIIVEENKVMDLLGAELQTVSEQTKVKYNIKNGLTVKILRDGLLKKSGIREGFTILFVDRQAVNSIKDVEKILSDKRGNVLIEGFYPNGFIYYYNITL